MAKILKHGFLKIARKLSIYPISKFIQVPNK